MVEEITAYRKIVGIDVSKRFLDVHSLPEGSARQFANDAKGIAALCCWIGAGEDRLAVLEPSGGYELSAQATLLKYGIKVTKVNARCVRDFARAGGILAKTDAIDARVLARYGQAMDVRELGLQSSEHQVLQALVLRRRQIVAMQVAEKNRMEKIPHPAVRQSIHHMLDVLQRSLQEVDTQIAEQVQSHETLHAKQDVLTAVKGIGQTTAAVLLAELPELGRISPRQISSLVGVAPRNHDSGALRGTRHIAGGRISVRCALYMGTVSAIRGNGVIADHYRHLKQRGKPSKVALTACMRKLIIILNAKIRDAELAA